MIEKKAFPDAIEQLTRAAELSPDNILAFQLLGDTYLEVRRPKDALNAFKMVLFLNPLHERAQKMVAKWEFLTADEFGDEDFEWTPSETDVVPEIDPKEKNRLQLEPTRADREAHRAISIADALTVRNDLDGAFAVLGRSIRDLGSRPDLEQRLELLGRRLGLETAEVLRLAKDSAQARAYALEPVVELSQNEKKKLKLKGLLSRLKPNS